MTCGEELKKRREAAGLSRDALAQLSGVSAMSIRRYENGEREPRLDAVTKLAAALDCTIFDFVDNWSECSIEDQRDAVLHGGQKAAMNAMYDQLTHEEQKKVYEYVSDMLIIHEYNASQKKAAQE